MNDLFFGYPTSPSSRPLPIFLLCQYRHTDPALDFWKRWLRSAQGQIRNQERLTSALGWDTFIKSYPADLNQVSEKLWPSYDELDVGRQRAWSEANGQQWARRDKRTLLWAATWLQDRLNDWRPIGIRCLHQKSAELAQWWCENVGIVITGLLYWHRSLMYTYTVAYWTS